MGDLITLVRCVRFAAGLPAAIRFAHGRFGQLNDAYDRLVMPVLSHAITDKAERSAISAALRAMSLKMGMAMLSYGWLAGAPPRPGVAALAGAVTRLYDDMIDASADGPLDNRIGDLFAGRPFTAQDGTETLLADLVGQIRVLVQPFDGPVAAVTELHGYQILSRQQRKPDVPDAMLAKICCGKGALANLTLCSLITPELDVSTRELIMALGETFQALDDYMDVDLDAGNGVATPARRGLSSMPEMGRNLRALRPQLVRRYGRVPARRYYGMIYFVLLKAVTERRLPWISRSFRRILGRSALSALVIKGTDALPAAGPEDGTCYG